MSEPGLDLHEWESMWASVAEDKDADPDAALSQFADIVARMLRSRGYNVDDPVEVSGDEPEIVKTYTAARDTAERAELGAASRAEVETAIEDLQDVFDTLIAERP
jgi:cupin superfamily acireductone dioxygenase involved in methionine salvage